jgi:hypothetical protein
VGGCCAMMDDLCYQAQRICGEDFYVTPSCCSLLLPSPRFKPRTCISRTVRVDQQIVFGPAGAKFYFGKVRGAFRGILAGCLIIYILLLYTLCSSELLQDFGFVDGQLSKFTLGVCMFIFVSFVSTLLHYIDVT